ncbi:MAG: hypothetical protein ABI629_24790 [bacterium]
MTKTHAWIFDAAGTAREGWLELLEEDGELRPADKAWQRIETLPPGTGPAGTTRLVLWADQRDKYIVRLDIGALHRWLICEQLPALLHAVKSLEALVNLGKRG